MGIYKDEGILSDTLKTNDIKEYVIKYLDGTEDIVTSGLLINTNCNEVIEITSNIENFDKLTKTIESFFQIVIHDYLESRNHNFETEELTIAIKALDKFFHLIVHNYLETKKKSMIDNDMKSAIEEIEQLIK